MSARNHIDPYGGLNPLVDSVLGPTAYEVVRFVATQMPVIQKVANEPYVRTFASGLTAGLVTSLLYPGKATLETLVDSTIWIRDPLTGSKYNADSGYFKMVYTTNGVTISIDPTAPTALQTGAEINWFLTSVEVR